MALQKVVLCTVAVLNIVTLLVAAPPRNVIEMKEGMDTKISEDTLAEKLDPEDLVPADHIDALKLEQDGDINKDYKKEIFLGEHEEIEEDDFDVAESKLKDIFVK